MITTVIIDDEKLARETLAQYVEQYCPQLSVVGLAGTFQEAFLLLDTHKPDIVFMDMELNDPDGGGIELLDLFPKDQFVVIFFTAWDKYVQESYRLNAIHYVKKPISLEVLKEAVAKAEEKVTSKRKPLPFYRLASVKGFEFIMYSGIIRLEAEGSVTHIYTIHKEKKTSSESIGEILSKLPQEDFYKTHRSHIVNRHFVRAFLKEGTLVLSDNTQIPVSSKNIQDFLMWFQSF